VFSLGGRGQGTGEQQNKTILCQKKSEKGGEKDKKSPGKDLWTMGVEKLGRVGVGFLKGRLIEGGKRQKEGGNYKRHGIDEKKFKKRSQECRGGKRQGTKIGSHQGDERPVKGKPGGGQNANHRISR